MTLTLILTNLDLFIVWHEHYTVESPIIVSSAYKKGIEHGGIFVGEGGAPKFCRDGRVLDILSWYCNCW